MVAHVDRFGDGGIERCADGLARSGVGEEELAAPFRYGELEEEVAVRIGVAHLLHGGSFLPQTDGMLGLDDYCS